MKKLLLSALSIAVLCGSAPAFADAKLWPFSWKFGHFSKMDFSQRYLNNGVDVHNRQWDGKPWNAEVWTGQEAELVEGFYNAGIIEDQKIKGDIPYLYVGRNFHHIGGYDQQRVLSTIDRLYNITDPTRDDLIYVYDREYGKIIGMYTKYGLTLH